MRRIRHRQRGQALAEFALALPLIILLGFAGTDMGRALYFRLPVAAAASAGARVGATADTNDIGSAIRTQSTALANTAADWGQGFTDGTHVGTASDCSNATVSSQRCGDPGGCGSASQFWSTAGPGVTDGTLPSACFAIRSCTVDTSGTAHSGQCDVATGCALPGCWQSRPASGSAQPPPGNPPSQGALEVLVVYRFVAATPVVSNFFTGPGHALFETTTSTTMEQY
jgi:hypothetical protein